ncbi:EAL domain-containing protein [Psychromarinibacter sp. C21-152]|uniref:EAL domain-containing protein n=1 Tax=Psychromarinibacter sediminicola TaxID=3033385 RepID=A0AAE3TAB3_9RHOB|nr:EAL domain-containing protein [Psychromarinibacter sediminicola]MDF0601824.1 EAL domain-containing protein [Psychromarinibacter sediminicola]
MLGELLYTIFYDHDPASLGVAILFCVTGSFLSVRMLRAYGQADGAQRRYRAWLLSIIAGGTIWTTHFIAVLGFRPELLTGHDQSLVALSLFIAIVAVLISVSAVSVLRGPVAPEAGGVLLGLGIAAMHYVGMAGFAIVCGFETAPGATVAAIALSCAGGALAFNRTLRRTRHSTLQGTAGLVLTVVLLHFTAMSALELDTTVAVPLPQGYFSAPGLVLPVALVMGLVLVLGLSSLQIDAISGSESVARLRKAARQDPLTGLANRTGFAEGLDAMRDPHGALVPFLLVTVDLDEFKQVNDTHGHAAGDELLRVAARCILDALPPGGLAARMGGDEFSLLVPGPRTEAEALEFGTLLVSRLNQPMRWEGAVIRCRASAGLVLCPAQGQEAPGLVAAAELALFDAKQRGGRRAQLYDAERARSLRDRRALGDDLARAFEAGELTLHYQPQFDLREKRITGFEALLRWTHPERGAVSPAVFVPLAEERGLIQPLGAWVLRTAAAEAAGWALPCRVAVNVAAPQFEGGGLVGTVREVLDDTGLPPDRLELEITETTVIDDLDSARRQVAELKRLGVLLAMDDYGTGYSALSTLLALPFDKIKFDRSFIQRMEDDTRMIGVLHSSVALGRHLGISVLAEGVETEAQADILSGLGCDEVQGFLLGRPMPAEEARRRFGLDGTAAGAWDDDRARDAAAPTRRSLAAGGG